MARKVRYVLQWAALVGGVILAGTANWPKH